jgi:hypothetical protein
MKNFGVQVAAEQECTRNAVMGVVFGEIWLDQRSRSSEQPHTPHHILAFWLLHFCLGFRDGKLRLRL